MKSLAAKASEYLLDAIIKGAFVVYGVIYFIAVATWEILSSPYFWVIIMVLYLGE